MSFFRKSVFWVIALVVLGGGFVLVNDRVEHASRVREASLRLFPFEPKDVTGFWIRKKGKGVLARIVRTADGWRIEEPLAAQGDAEAIEKLLGNTVNARKDAVLFESPDPAKLAELGLDSPGLEMGFRVGGGSTVIRFGVLGPTHNVTYAMLDEDSRVYRIHSDVREEANTSVYALRDKTVLSFDPARLRRLTLERNGMGRVTILRDDQGRWDMTEPDRTRASMVRVLQTLYEIRNAQVKAFVDEAPAGLAPYGLDAPRIRVSVLEQGQEKAQVLTIGTKDRTRRGYFAKAGRGTNVFVVEEGLVNALLADPDRWKDKGGGA